MPTKTEATNQLSEFANRLLSSGRANDRTEAWRMAIHRHPDVAGAAGVRAEDYDAESEEVEEIERPARVSRPHREVSMERQSTSQIANEIDHAAKYLARQSGLSYHQAYARILSQSPDLYAQYKDSKGAAQMLGLSGGSRGYVREEW